MRPKSVEDLVGAVAEANRLRVRLFPTCLGSKAGMGPPAAYDELLELTSMPRAVEVDEEEMVVKVSACYPAASLQEELARRGRRLAMDPPLFTKSSIGGIIATNFYGPMAYRYMTPRDQLLSVRAVTGGGQLVKFGAPVMKDVAGYNLKRLLAGSWGTLAVIIEAFLRIYALPESVAVVETDPKPLGDVRKLLPTAALEKNGKLYLRFEGTAAEVEYRVAKAGRGEAYYGADAEALWQSATEAIDVFSSDVVYKVVAPPAQLPPPPSGARYVKYPLLGVMYVGGEAGVGYRLKPPQKWQLPNADLMARIKQVFDPNGVLAPGRLP